MSDRVVAGLELVAAIALITIQNILYRYLGLTEHLLIYAPGSAEHANPGEWTLQLLLLLGVPAVLLIADASRRAANVAVFSALAARPRIVAAVAALGAMVVAIVVTRLVTHGAAFTDDERTLTWQARALLDGGFTSARPHPAAAFPHHFMIAVGEDRWGGVFPTGQPLLLAIGTTLGSLHITQWLGCAALVWFGARAAAWLWDAETSVVVALLLATSPAVVLTSATLHTIIPTAACVAVAIYAVARFIRGAMWAAALLGASAGLALTCRPLDGTLLAVFGAACLLFAGGKQHRLKALALATLAGLPFVAVHLSSQAALTGNPLVTPYQIWIDRDWPGAKLFGFGKTIWDHNHTLVEASQKTVAAGLRMSMWAFGWALSWIALPLWALGRGRDRTTSWLVAFISVHAAAYFFYVFGAVHDFGSYYHLFSVPPLAFITARVAMARGERSMRLLTAAVVGGLATFWPMQLQRLAFMAERTNAPLVAADEVAANERVVVFHDSMHGIAPLGSWVYFAPLPDPDDHDQVLWARTLDPRIVADVLRAHPDRRPYVLRWIDGSPHMLTVPRRRSSPPATSH